MAIAMASLSTTAAAQSADGNAVEYVDVVGQAVQIDKALGEQRRSDRIQSVVHADGIGQLPDDNAAEALQRIPGISVERDQGEGRFVSIRGIAPDLNSVTINGTLVPAPESDRRAVALDVLPSELIQSITAVKTLTPDMDANSLGGTVEVHSLSAFDHEGLFRTLSVEGSHDDNSGENSPKISGAISNRFDIGGGRKNFGVAAAVSWQKRKFGSDNVETGGAWDLSDPAVPRLEKMEQRRYDITRERLGVGLNFDYQPDDTSNYYLRTLFSRYSDTEQRNAAGVEFADPLAPGETGDAEGYRELKSRKETQQIQSYVLGGERSFGLWTASGQLGYSKASEKLPFGIAGAGFEGNDDFSNAGYTNPGRPRLNIGAGFYDPTEFTLDEVEAESQKTTDTEKSIRLDLARQYDWNGHASEIKFGGKISRRDKRNELNVWKYDDFGSAPTGLDSYAGSNARYGLGYFGPGISDAAIRRLLATLDHNAAYDEEESRINDFRMSEDINAAYVMNTIDIDKWRVIAGLRYEGTRFSASGTGINDGEFEENNSIKRYHHWLPGLHGSYQLNDRTKLRAAWTNTVVRPTFEALAPGFVIDDDEASFGNPDLDPLKARNIDVGIEHYMGRAGVLSAFVFHKDIKNFVYQTDLAGNGRWADFSEAVTFANGNEAKLYGLELAYSQKLDWLPSPWNGLLVGANATFSHSRAEIEGLGTRRTIDLPNQSSKVGNLMLGWENRKFSTRLSANYKSSYLAEVAAVDDANRDRHADSQLFVDFSASYYITPKIKLSFMAQNLTNESYYIYSGRRDLNAQYEKYGPTYKISLTLTDF
ncbi:TonB-dependent receptor [Oxalicibacterium flavum]|uniref:TonB-dependent receptor n=2 Tax=Oxalicibacterium flavum TaxID=179467 RepID=A0A8J2XX92_9BURK|nr:TonB-dependent receptor [Oxalicibacterium flavum]